MLRPPPPTPRSPAGSTASRAPTPDFRALAAAVRVRRRIGDAGTRRFGPRMACAGPERRRPPAVHEAGRDREPVLPSRSRSNGRAPSAPIRRTPERCRVASGPDPLPLAWNDGIDRVRPRSRVEERPGGGGPRARRATRRRRARQQPHSHALSVALRDLRARPPAALPRARLTGRRDQAQHRLGSRGGNARPRRGRGPAAAWPRRRRPRGRRHQIEVIRHVLTGNSVGRPGSSIGWGPRDRVPRLGLDARLGRKRPPAFAQQGIAGCSG